MPSSSGPASDRVVVPELPSPLVGEVPTVQDYSKPPRWKLTWEFFFCFFKNDFLDVEKRLISGLYSVLLSFSCFSCLEFLGTHGRVKVVWTAPESVRPRVLTAGLGQKARTRGDEYMVQGMGKRVLLQLCIVWPLTMTMANMGRYVLLS